MGDVSLVRLAELACADQASSLCQPAQAGALFSVQPTFLPPSDTLSPSPFPRMGFSISGTANGDVYIFGGYTSKRLNDLYYFSTEKNTLTLLHCSGETPSPRCFHSSVIIGGVLAVWGGGCTPSQAEDDSLYLLDLVSYNWTRIPIRGQGPKACFQHTMATIGKKLFVFGGRGSKGTLVNNSELWAFDFTKMATSPTWEIIEPSSRERADPRAGHTCISYQDQLIILGGQTNDPYGSWQDLNNIWSFNVITRQWTKSQSTIPKSFPCLEVTSAIIDDVAYLFGGNYSVSRREPGTFNALKLSTQQWFTLNNQIPVSCLLPTKAGIVGIGTRLFLFEMTVNGYKNTNSGNHIHVLDTENINELGLREAGRRKDSMDVNERQKEREFKLWETRLEELKSEMVEAAKASAKRDAEREMREAKAVRALEAEVKALRAEVDRLRELKGDTERLCHVPTVARTSTETIANVSLRNGNARPMVESFRPDLGAPTTPRVLSSQSRYSDRAELKSGRYVIFNPEHDRGLGYACWDEDRNRKELQCHRNDDSNGTKWVIDFDSDSASFTIAPLVGNHRQREHDGHPKVGFRGGPHISQQVLAWQTHNSGGVESWYVTRAKQSDEFYIRSIRGKLAWTVENNTAGNEDCLQVLLQDLDQNNPFQIWKLERLSQ